MCYFLKKILKILKRWKYGKFCFEVSHVKGVDFDFYDILIFLAPFKIFQKKILYVVGKLKEQKIEIFQAFLFFNMFSLKNTARKLEKNSLTLNYAALSRP